MSPRTKTFITLIAYLGLGYLALSVANLHVEQPARFYIYLAMAVLCSIFQARNSGVSVAFSLNLPVVLISIVELSRPEAVAIGCGGALVQCLWDPQVRRRPSQVVFHVTALATIIAIAHFTLTSFLPASLGSVTMRLFLVTVAFFVANTLPAAIVHRFGSKERLGQIWKQNYLWSFPYYLVAAALAGVVHAANSALNLDTALLALPVVYVVYRAYRLQKSQLEEQQKHAGEMAALHLRAIEGLALAVEAKDAMNTRGHLRRVQLYSVELGKELGLKGGELEALHAGALLHDIGKLAVPEHILTKPGKLTPEEFAKLKVHPVVGAEIVEQVQFPYPVAPIVRAHHERWDGSGYPYGLKSEEIPLGARILSAVDCLDALTSDREYRPALPLDEAMNYIQSQSGAAFDPQVVKVLERRYRDLDQMVKANLNNAPSLSTNAVIKNGRAPAAGLDLFGSSLAADSPLDFLGTIAAARREDQVLGEISKDLGTSLDLEETLSNVEQRLQEMIEHDALGVFIRRANTLYAKFAAGRNERVLTYLEVPAGEGLVGWVAENGNPVVNGNPAVDPGFYSDPEQLLQSALAIPLEGANGIIGVMVLYHRGTDGFTNEHLRMMLSITPKIGLAVENAMKYREADERANTDALTGLPNGQLLRQSLDTAMARARRLGQPLAVMHCTADGFQKIANERGAAAADEMLAQFARLMKQDCREYDHIGRIGPADFGLVMPGMKPDSVEAKLDRLRELAATARLADCGIRLSTGQAFYPEDGDGSAHLLGLAVRRSAELHPVARPAELTATLTSLSDALAQAPNSTIAA
jgi:diguanylate cyclase (GGDEF)-like protein/putative nucleotidyltransferase with HDIG domain